jgi:hypothetical protein
MWTYRCYDDGTKPNLWQDWHDSALDAQGSHESVFDALEQMDNWREPYTKIINRRERIIEARINGDVKWRVFGFFGEQRREFIVLGIGFHKQKVYDPPDILETIVKRKKEIVRDLGKAPPCVRPK